MIGQAVLLLSALLMNTSLRLAQFSGSGPTPLESRQAQVAFTFVAVHLEAVTAGSAGVSIDSLRAATALSATAEIQHCELGTAVLSYLPRRHLDPQVLPGLQFHISQQAGRTARSGELQSGRHLADDPGSLVPGWCGLPDDGFWLLSL